jgi:hypothetical protein
MKTPLLRVIFAWCAAGTALAAEGGSPSPKAVINFDNWQKYTDIKDSEAPTEKGQRAILDQIDAYLVKDASRVVPDGNVLTITFQDIDLAGDFEPWHGAQWDDIRVVKDIYPPRFVFTWSVTDPTGKIVKQGKEDILDMAFQTRITIFQDDPLRYEKQILDDWMHAALRSLKTS